MQTVLQRIVSTYLVHHGYSQVYLLALEGPPFFRPIIRRYFLFLIGFSFTVTLQHVPGVDPVAYRYIPSVRYDTRSYFYTGTDISTGMLLLSNVSNLGF